MSTGKCNTSEKEIIVLDGKQKHSQLLNNGDGTYLHISGDGTVTQINADTSFNLIDNCDGTLTIETANNDPVVVDICKIVGESCNAELVFNSNGTISFTDNAGVTTITNFPVSQLTDNGNGTITHVSGDNTITTFNVCSLVANNCSCEVVDNGDGSFTHIAVDGSVVFIPAPPTSAVIDFGNGTYSHDDGLGNITLLNSGATIQQATSAFTSDNNTAVAVNDYYIQLPNGQTWA